MAGAKIGQSVARATSCVRASIHGSALRWVLLLILGVSLFVHLGCDRSEDKTSQALRSLFPEKGYFEPLDSVEVDLGTQNGVYQVSWEHQASGTYSLGLSIASPPSINAGNVVFDGVLGVKVVRGEREVFSRNTNLRTAALYVKSPGVSGGVTVWRFEVPEQLPFDEQIVCEVRVVEADPVFQARHNPIELYIVKEPDL